LYFQLTNVFDRRKIFTNEGLTTLNDYYKDAKTFSKFLKSKKLLAIHFN